jgi:mono/diheme cytochrome c family protein
MKRTFTSFRPRRAGRVALIAAGLAALSACRQDMMDQARLKPLGENAFFADGMASRPLIEGTIARDQLRLDEHFYTGKVGGQWASTLPIEVNADVLKRGQDRFNIYCAPCHDRAGTGNGMIVQRGYRRPSSFHVDRLREIAPGYFFDVISHGFGFMPDYATQISPPDRWAVVAYIRALQLSQWADAAALSEADRAELAKSAEPATPREDHADGH